LFQVVVRGWDLQQALQQILAEKAAHYNCSMQMAYHDNKTAYSMASGQSNRKSARNTTVDDRFVWGSVTKVMTGSSVLRLGDLGEINLEGSIVPLIDPFISKSMPSLKALEYLFGQEVADVTVRDLLGMTSGIPDFDTANPWPKDAPVDPFRATVYANPDKVYGPEELLSMPWVKTGKLNFTPGTCDWKKYGNCYSSTNFVLLGLILAQHSGAESWNEFEQLSIMPKSVQKELSHTRFAKRKPASEFTQVHGYDLTNYNNRSKIEDVFNVTGVFAGWSASDLTAPASDVAALVYEVYGPE